MSSTAAPVTAAAPVGAPPPVQAVAAPGAWRRVLRRPLAVAGIAILGLYLLAVTAGPSLDPTSANATTAAPLLGIGAHGHPLGTDELGHDLLARYLVGGRPLLIVAFASCIAASALGTLIGLVAGYGRGPVDSVSMRVMDVLLALPVVLLAVLLAASLGAGIGNLVIAISVAQIPYVARFVRQLTARESTRDYVRSARALGLPAWKVMFGEILPNIAGPLLVQATSILAVSAGFAAGLSFIGVGLPPTVADWGYMVKVEEQFVFGSPMLVVIPALLITGFVLATNLVGDEMRDVLDPRTR